MIDPYPVLQWSSLEPHVSTMHVSVPWPVSLKFWKAFMIYMFPAFNDVMVMFGDGVFNIKHTRFTSPNTELVPDHIPANISDPGPHL